MAVFKCKMCGGSLEVSEGMTVCECDYCGTQQTVPSADNEKKVNLFNRANRLRIASEFDKAAGIYESIVSEFPEEAEAYWGLCLCKYGIEYVDDPATAKKIPTCHRTSYDSIFGDSNYKAALDHADSVANSLYQSEAAEIDRLQKAILDIAKNEAPYDVFICYKETAEDGQRTKDSVLAQDIYDALTSKDYKVFFARITLEDKLGQQYEPYIFSALNSAKVMLAIGTKEEYFNAVWVKNEWSRFLGLMKSDKSKVLIPCYSDIDAYDMPDEFKNLQAQDMGKVGFIQDLIRGIGKVIPKEQAQAVQQVIQQVVSSGTNVDNLLKRGNLCLEDRKWDEAAKFFDEVLDENAEDYRAYIGLLCAEQNASNEQALERVEKDYTCSDFYKKACRFGGSDVQNRLFGYYQQGLYNKAERTLQKAQTTEECDEAKCIFRAAPDSIDLAVKALSVFNSLGDYKDSAKRAEYLRDKIYQQALECIQHYKYKEAMDLFNQVLEYKDSTERASECRRMFPIAESYDNAMKQMRNVQYMPANSISKLSVEFAKISNYRDSAALAKECIKRAAIKREEESIKRNKESNKNYIRAFVISIIIVVIFAVIGLIYYKSKGII